MTTLRQFQEEDVTQAGERFGLNCLLGLDTGLGKTVEALFCVKRYLKKGPVVVVCPATIKVNWQREAYTHIGARAVVLGTRTPPDNFGVGHRPNTIYVINYDVLGPYTGGRQTWTDVLVRLKPQLLIIDECHKIRGRRTVRTRAVQAIARHCPRRMGLSASPVVNRPVEFFPILNIVRPDLFPHFGPFAKRYCNPRWTIYGWDYRGASNLGELNYRLRRDVMIRRRKADVLDQLPVKTRTVIPVPLDPESRAEYDEANRSFLTWLAKTKHVKNGQAKVRGASKAERLTQMGYLLRLAAKLKFGSVVEWTSDFLETGGKLIAFAVQRQLTQDLAAHFGQAAVLVNGSVTGRHRQAAIDRFNRDKSCRLLSGNIEAAGEGWSCKSTSTEMFYQLPWQPGMLMQAEDRIEGIERGLPGAAAQIYFLVAENTIEEWLCKVLIGKRKILDQVMDGQDTGELDSILSQVESMVERSGRMVTDKSKDNRKMVRTAVNDVVRVFMGGL